MFLGKMDQLGFHGRSPFVYGINSV